MGGPTEKKPLSSQMRDGGVSGKGGLVEEEEELCLRQHLLPLSEVLALEEAAPPSPSPSSFPPLSLSASKAVALLSLSNAEEERQLTAHLPLLGVKVREASLPHPLLSSSKPPIPSSTPSLPH